MATGAPDWACWPICAEIQNEVESPMNREPSQPKLLAGLSIIAILIRRYLGGGQLAGTY